MFIAWASFRNVLFNFPVRKRHHDMEQQEILWKTYVCQV